jgi:histone-lysine N-methyltransferase SETMAR
MVLPIKSSMTSSASIKSVRDGCQKSLLKSTSARPHTASQTVETINHLGFEMLEHPAYSPDLAPSDYHLFGLLKNALQGRRFSTDKEVQKAVHKMLRDQTKTFFLEGKRKLVDRWTKCIEKEGDYVEK